MSIGADMIKVKTFTNELLIFHTMNELKELDEQVNSFIEDNGISNVISVSDTCTIEESKTCGIIRVLTYEE
jgi:predicted GTPase